MAARIVFDPPRPPPLHTKEAILAYLSDVIDQGNHKLLVYALADIAKAVRALPAKAER